MLVRRSTPGSRYGGQSTGGRVVAVMCEERQRRGMAERHRQLPQPCRMLHAEGGGGGSAGDAGAAPACYQLVDGAPDLRSDGDAAEGVRGAADEGARAQGAVAAPAGRVLAERYRATASGAPSAYCCRCSWYIAAVAGDVCMGGEV